MYPPVSGLAETNSVETIDGSTCTNSNSGIGLRSSGEGGNEVRQAEKMTPSFAANLHYLTDAANIAAINAGAI